MTYEPTPYNHTYTYDGENRMVSFSGSGIAPSYGYDGNGIQVKRTLSGTTVTSIYSGKNVIAEYTGTTLTREYVYGPQGRLAVIEGSTTKYYSRDHLFMSDSSGNVISGSQNAHYPYGESWVGNSDKEKFTTYQRASDAEGDYAIMRQYLARCGRFTSPDPMAGDIADPQSLNRYAYVINDPINLVDPLGLNWLEAIWNWLMCKNGDCTGGSGGGGGGAHIGQLIDSGELEPDFAALPPSKQPCDVTIPGGDAGILSRLIFAEATSSGITADNSQKEMNAIASVVLNRVSYLQLKDKNGKFQEKLNYFGASARSIAGVVTKGQFSSVGGNRYNVNPSNLDTASKFGKIECDLLKRAVSKGLGSVSGSVADPFASYGGVYALLTAGSGSPGGAFWQFPAGAQVPGSANTFYGLNAKRP